MNVQQSSHVRMVRRVLTRLVDISVVVSVASKENIAIKARNLFMMNFMTCFALIFKFLFFTLRSSQCG